MQAGLLLDYFIARFVPEGMTGGGGDARRSALSAGKG
jgi:hypothetical protein